MTLKQFLLTSAAFTVVTALPLSAMAADVAVKAPPPEPVAESGWTYSGEFEAGWRAFIRRPPHSAFPWNGVSTTNPGGYGDRNNISKFEEYGKIPPGPYGEYLRATLETKDGLWWNELRADNIGNNNQRYVYDFIKTGEHYLTLSWDQIPHLYSTSAYNIWNGVGTNNLTTSVAIPAYANYAPLCGAPAGAGVRTLSTATPASRCVMESLLNGKANIIDVGIQRDKAAAAYRWTPDPYWDIKASYSHEKREGTQVAGVVFSGPGLANGQMFNAPRPVDDTTQIGKLNTEYFGATPWGGRFNVNFGGGVSLFDNTMSSYTVQNPFSDPTRSSGAAGAPAGFQAPPAARISLAPSNQAYSGIINTGVDLPMKSRWNSTLQYTSMRQNEQFQPFTATQGIYLNAPGYVGVPAWTTAGLPAQSLNGEVNTTLYNTNLSTQWTPQWRTTFKYRYYDNDNRTPELLLPPYVVEDATAVTAAIAGLGTVAVGSGGNAAATNPTFRRALAMSYTKQNASEEFQWRPANWATFGSIFGWEGWDRTRREANHTNEFIGKGTADLRFSDIAKLRSSLQYSERRWDAYDPRNLALYTWQSTNPVGTTSAANTNYLMRKFDMANRDQLKGMAILDISGPSGTVFRDFVISPSLGLKNDDYREDPATFGLKKSHGWNAGIDGTYTFKPGNWIQASYLYEQYDRFQAGSSSGSSPTVPQPVAGTVGWSGNTHERVHTIMASTNFELIPGKLDFKLGYSISFSAEDWDYGNYQNYNPQVTALTGSLPFPTVKNNYQRLDASLKHLVDPAVVAKLGWTGDVYVKARYIWERNSATNWQQEYLTPYLYMADTTGVRAIEMGAINPNYDAQYVQLSLNATW
jgi:MtrB/PioB family decaheme-associated outer membrane protein